MNVNEFRRRWLLSKIRPELFYADLKNKTVYPDLKGQLYISLVSYRYYDVEINEYVTEYTKAVYGAIVIKNSSGKIVYNSRKSIGDRVDGNDDRSAFTINDLPYGKYSVKVIRSAWAEPDKEWHDIILNDSKVNVQIILDWQMDGVFLTDTAYDADYVTPCIVISPSEYIESYKIQFPSDTGCFHICSSFEQKGNIICKLYEGFDRHSLLMSRFYNSNSGDISVLYNFLINVIPLEFNYVSKMSYIMDYYNDYKIIGTKEIKNHGIEKKYVINPATETEEYLLGFKKLSDTNIVVNTEKTLNYTSTIVYGDYGTPCGIYSLTEINWSVSDTEYAINGKTSGSVTNNSYTDELGNGRPKKFWYDAQLDSYYSYVNYFYDDLSYYIYSNNYLKKYVESKEKNSDFIEGWDIGLIAVLEPDRPLYTYSNKENYDNAIRSFKEQGIKIIYKTVLKNYHGDNLDKILNTEIGKLVVDGGNIWLNQEIGIRYKGLYWSNKNYRTMMGHVHENVQPALTTTYMIIGRMKYSDDYHEYDP